MSLETITFKKTSRKCIDYFLIMLFYYHNFDIKKIHYPAILKSIFTLDQPFHFRYVTINKTRAMKHMTPQ